jgi:polyisoprenoid-binding protein YceI
LNFVRYASFFVLLLLVVMPAQATDWQSRSDGEFTFEVSFEGVGVLGEFKHFDVILKLDPKKPDTSRLRVTVDLSAADMGDPDMTEGIADTDWFHVGKYPRAVFESKKIEAGAPGKYVSTGILTLKGVSKPVTVPFSWSEKGKRASMRGEFIVQRTGFNVGSGEWASADPIGIDVKLKFDVSLKRGN